MVLTVLRGRRINENMVWTDSQDLGADEILNTTELRYLTKESVNERNYDSFQGLSPVVPGAAAGVSLRYAAARKS